MAAFREEVPMEMGDGDGADDEGAESSYGTEFTAEDAAVRGSAPRDVVVPSNILSAIAGATPAAAPGYGLLSSSNPALEVNHARDAVIPGEDGVDVTQEGLVVEDLAPDADESQPVHLVGALGRERFDLRSFAAAHALDNPVAAVYVTAE